jgi:hypothetical protein
MGLFVVLIALLAIAWGLADYQLSRMPERPPVLEVVAAPAATTVVPATSSAADPMAAENEKSAPLEPTPSAIDAPTVPDRGASPAHTAPEARRE